MQLQQAKEISLIFLFVFPLIATSIAIFLQKFVFQRVGEKFSVAQRTISSLTSGIFFGTFLILILPNSLQIGDEQWENKIVAFVLIGLGFFLICFVKILVEFYESFSNSSNEKNEEQQLIERSTSSSDRNQWTQLITVVFSLSVHYFFSGVLIGGQTNDTSAFWLLVFVICFHMCLVAFSVTLRLLIDNENFLRVFLGMSFWSLMGSLGLFISSYSFHLNSINAILQCLSAGTFLYITFVDMIAEDLKTDRRSTFFNVFLISFGFFLVALTGLLHQHPH